MLSPLPRNKRAKNPKDVETEGMPEKKTPAAGAPSPEKSKAAKQIPTNAAETAFANNPFAQIDAAKLNP